MHRIIQRFIEHCSARLPEFDAALAAGDFETLTRHAHWLKGAGGTVGFDAFTEPAAELEAAAKAAEPERCAHWLAQVRALGARMQAPATEPSVTESGQ